MLKTAILIPVFNNLAYTRNCLANLNTILKNTDEEHNFPIVVIDDGSTDGTFEAIKKEYPHVHLLKGDGNLWWSGGVNVGANYAIDTLHCDYVLLWNNDVQIKHDYFKKALAGMETWGDETILGTKVYADIAKDIVWTMGGIFNPITGYFGMKAFMVYDNDDFKKPLEADWLTGMGTFIPTKIIRKIGLWDDKNFPQYHGDTEFTYRAKLQGFKNVVLPELILWNDTRNTGLNHSGSFKKLKRMLSDRRSLYNWKVNTTFLKMYGKGPYAYQHLGKQYAKLFLGFAKWKFLGMLGLKKTSILDK